MRRDILWAINSFILCNKGSIQIMASRRGRYIGCKLYKTQISDSKLCNFWNISKWSVKTLYFQPNFCKESTKLSSTNPDKIRIESYVLLHFLKYFVPCILEILSFFWTSIKFPKIWRDDAKKWATNWKTVGFYWHLIGHII